MEKSPTDGTRPKRTAAQRKCLKCEDVFKSKSKCHRLCEPCKCMNAGIDDIEIELPRELMKRLRFQNKRKEGYYG